MKILLAPISTWSLITIGAHLAVWLSILTIGEQTSHQNHVLANRDYVRQNP